MPYFVTGYIVACHASHSFEVAKPPGKHRNEKNHIIAGSLRNICIFDFVRAPSRYPHKVNLSIGKPYSNLFWAILITGGYGSGSLYATNGVAEESELKSVEIYLPSSNTSCSLPELPEVRGSHTQNGGLACGGGYNSTWSNCVKWGDGSWTRTHILREKRTQHVSWTTASGVYLIGGQKNGNTSDLVKEDGSVEEGLPLKNNTE